MSEASPSVEGLGQRARHGRRHIPSAIRLVITFMLVFWGGLSAFICTFAAFWEHSGPGQTKITSPNDVVAVLYAVGALISVLVPAAASWYLLPQVRWAGGVIMLVVVIALSALFLNSPSLRQAQ